MLDLVEALILMVSLSVTAFIAGMRLGRSVQLRYWLFGGSVVGAILSQRLLTDGLVWARLFPNSSSTVVWANATPILLAAAFGVMLQLERLALWRRAVSASMLALLAGVSLFYPVLRPILRPVVRIDRLRWENDVCLQSADSTCCSAAAATLLRQHQVQTTERAMEPLCLTSEDGASALGVYRGIYTATSGHPLKPNVICGSFETFMKRKQFPSIVIVRHARDCETWRTRLIGSFGHRQGAAHAVVVFGIKHDGQLDIGDPAIGRNDWDVKTLRERWAGEAIYLDRAS